jgi:DNA-directed RNA polymerase omega subunit
MRTALTVDDIFEQFPNKYEAIIVIAREARRLNEIGRTLSPEKREKAQYDALLRVLEGNVDFSYRKKVRPRPWPEMAGPEVLEMREEPVTPPPTGLWKDEEEELDEGQEDQERQPDEEEEQKEESDEEAEPSAEEIMSEDLPEDTDEETEPGEEEES